MKRDDLREVIAASCDAAGVTPEAKERLVATADSIDRVAFETFGFRDDNGLICGCPATVAGYWDGERWTDEAHEHRAGRFPGYFDDRVRGLVNGGQIKAEESEAVSLDEVYLGDEADKYPHTFILIED